MLSQNEIVIVVIIIISSSRITVHCCVVLRMPAVCRIGYCFVF